MSDKPKPTPYVVHTNAKPVEVEIKKGQGTAKLPPTTKTANGSR